MNNPSQTIYIKGTRRASMPCIINDFTIINPHETDHHKSMLDLVDDDRNHDNNYVESANFSYPSAVCTDIIDPNIRICVNGVTVDSSTDYSTSNHSDQSVNDIKYINKSISRIQNDEAKVRRRSWCPNTTSLEEEDEDSKDHSTRVRMLALTGKRLKNNITTELITVELLSICSCRNKYEPEQSHGDDGSDEEDYQDAREQATPSLSRIKLGEMNKPVDFSTTADYPGSGPTVEDMPDASSYFARLLTEGAVSGPMKSEEQPSDPVYKRSNSEVEETATKEVTFRTYSVEASKSRNSYDEADSSCLNIPHSSMTKSISTPSIPAAGQKTTEDRKSSLRREANREGKHALFRRQREVEEFDEDSVTSNKKASISLQDFLNEELKRSPSPDSDDKNKQTKKEEGKKRKTSVFSRISYRNKKKEKENKVKNTSTHQFVSICYSNNTACHVCHKTMANKPALKCENCLINVHENNCQDQIMPCDKNRMVKFKLSEQVC
ncbi:hypothetical protein LOTGIDRAFT_157703 [Lottia gigantea]|uniref:Phorbol-ester/DAG-type domain-containing protein n=1 Tax=Lottia gigantea TaxID=225164 RepID=V4AT97_LOTGI|nr:hypothetical protein LOTGIDRAFT_157703 [Lottia gigantea]ESP00498.1 hypothetical protein LOTGIDRAFT_157703 [Lottia gigantea]